jgi:hypothetical protein
MRGFDMSRIAKVSPWRQFCRTLAAMCLTALFAIFLFARPMATAAAEEADAEADESPAEAAADAAPAAAAAAPEAAATAPAGQPKKDEKPKENLGQRRQGDVGRNEELSFLQAKVTAQMSELEERMFRLSEALKGLEPENASRLLIGLKYAREELIGLQMKEVQLALSALKYSDAVVEEKQLLAKLQRLEQLLLSPDLDFQLQLERLRLMRDLMRRLDGAIKEEEREKSATDQSAAVEKQLEELRERMATLQEIIKRQTAHIQDNQKLAAVKDPDGVKDPDKKADNPPPAAKAPA